MGFSHVDSSSKDSPQPPPQTHQPGTLSKAYGEFSWMFFLRKISPEQNDVEDPTVVLDEQTQLKRVPELKDK